MNEAPTVAAGSPKLLELDKRDVEAVRSFLPGKVLGRTAALLALVVLVLGFAGSLNVGLEPDGVLVVLDASHRCVTARGARQVKSTTVTA